MTTPPFDPVAEAFSRNAEEYDAFAEDHPHLTRIRRKVYAHIAGHAPKGARILELNAGTGIDASELARRGYRVHATDIASGMLNRARTRANDPELAGRLTVQLCSYLDLTQIERPPFDLIFSNLGGLNCIPDLRPVIRQLPCVLRPGGIVTWVLMPPICLWELADVFRGHPKQAFRRLPKKGASVHLKGLVFQSYYFQPGVVAGWFGEDYELLAIEGLSVFMPTIERKSFVKRHARLYRALAWLDDRLSPSPPWRAWGDFYIITLRYRPMNP